MEKFDQLQKIKEIYAEGGNIIEYLKNTGDSRINTIEDILISYDFQAGSYTKRHAMDPGVKLSYGKALAKIFEGLGGFQSIIEVGVGEATTLLGLLENLTFKPKSIAGLDISWSRLKFASKILEEHKQSNVSLFTANLFEIPLPDNSVDIVYTSHALEPNGGKEREGLMELYRVAKKYLILLEPSYEFANEEQRLRMKSHGYVTNLFSTAKDLGFKIIEHRLFEHYANPDNPRGLMIIEKSIDYSNEMSLVCPVSKTLLRKVNDTLLYSEESLLAYPIVEEIPCLLRQNSILASHLLTDYDDFKRQNNIKF